MSWCDRVPCRVEAASGKREDARVSEDDAHYFSGYGFLVRYHPECCPRSVDGTDCDHDHPKDMP